MRRLVVGTLDRLMLRHPLHALEAETVTAGEREGLLVVVVVRLEADATLENGVHHFNNYSNHQTTFES